MPTELGNLQVQIMSDMIWLHIRWKLYRQLFGTSPERIDLLNRFGGFLVNNVQTVMWEDVTLRICRLMDPAKKKKYTHQNRSLKQLVNLMDQSEPGASSTVVTRGMDGTPGTETLDNALVRAKDLCAPFRERRNRVIAHADAECMGTPLTVSSRAEVEQLLAVYRDVFNGVLHHYGQALFGQNDPPMAPPITAGDGDEFIARLQSVVGYLEAEGRPGAGT